MSKSRNFPKLRKKDIHAHMGQYGQWVCEAFVEGFIEFYQFYGYTKKEAVDEFYRRYA